MSYYGPLNDKENGIWCKNGGTMTQVEDEYNGLSGGGDYEVFDCTCKTGRHYLELPD